MRGAPAVDAAAGGDGDRPEETGDDVQADPRGGRSVEHDAGHDEAHDEVQDRRHRQRGHHPSLHPREVTGVLLGVGDDPAGRVEVEEVAATLGAGRSTMLSAVTRRRRDTA